MSDKTRILLIIICVCAILYLMFVATPMALASWPDCNPSDNNIKILSGNTITASGTCTYIIDLADYCIKTGDFSIQFSGVTCAWEVGSSVSPMAGATIFASYRMSNHMPSGSSVVKGLNPHDVVISNTLESLSIVSNMAFDTGNTDYVYDFFPEPCRYILIDVSSGATPMITDLWLNMY